MTDLSDIDTTPQIHVREGTILCPPFRIPLISVFFSEWEVNDSSLPTMASLGFKSGYNLATCFKGT